MTVSLPIADRPPHDEPTVVVVPLESRLPVTFESVPLDEVRLERLAGQGAPR